MAKANGKTPGMRANLGASNDNFKGERASHDAAEFQAGWDGHGELERLRADGVDESDERFILAKARLTPQPFMVPAPKTEKQMPALDFVPSPEWSQAPKKSTPADRSNVEAKEPANDGPDGAAGAQDWISRARFRATEIVNERRKRDLYPSQIMIADEIAKEFRRDGVVGKTGKPLTGEYIKRHALKGISSAIGKRLSTNSIQGK